MFTPFGQRWLPALGRWLHCIGGTVFTPFDFRQVAALYSDHYRGGGGGGSPACMHILLPY